MNRDRPLRDRFGLIPNAMWTLDLPPTPRLMLGWLHSHADNYLERLSLNRIGREFGCGTKARKHLDVLAEDGWLLIVPAGRGEPARVVLLSDPWDDLMDRSRKGDTPQPFRERGYNPLVNTENTTPEQQEIETPDTSEIVTSVPDLSFESFWKQYPRKEGKHTARSKWDKMNDDERTAAAVALDWWTDYYATIDPKFIPHGSTWLNQRRWEDNPPDTPEPPTLTVVPSVQCDECDGTGWVEVDDPTLRAGRGMTKCECQRVP